MKNDLKNMDKWDLPIGFAMALSENPAAMKAFANLPKEQRENCIEQAKAADSKAKMQRLANDLASTGFLDFI